MCTQTFGTSQIAEILIYKGDTLLLYDCPLGYLKNPSFTHPRNLFGSKGCFYTSCARNYVATWEIINDKLYLNNIKNACYRLVADSIKSSIDSIGTEYADLKRLFPDKYEDGRVLADWVTAKMISPKGEMLYHISLGFLSIYEKETEFTIENGLLVNIQEFDNSKTRASKYIYNLELASEYVRDNIDYANLPETEEIVKVIVIVISADDSGKIDEARVMRGFNEAYDKEALRVVKSIPDWDVLYRHGEKVRGPAVSFTVTFNRQKK